MVRQIEQNVTKADLLAEMATANTMQVEIDPPTPIAFQLVTFRVRFDRPGFDSAVAQDEIACTWFVDDCPIDSRDALFDVRTSQSDGRHARGWVRGECFMDNDIEWLRLPKLGWRWVMSRNRAWGHRATSKRPNPHHRGSFPRAASD